MWNGHQMHALISCSAHTYPRCLTYGFKQGNSVQNLNVEFMIMLFHCLIVYAGQADGWLPDSGSSFWQWVFFNTLSVHKIATNEFSQCGHIQDRSFFRHTHFGSSHKSVGCWGQKHLNSVNTVLRYFLELVAWFLMEHESSGFLLISTLLME